VVIAFRKETDFVISLKLYCDNKKSLCESEMKDSSDFLSI